MIQRYFTPEEYVFSCIAKYPSVYSSPTLELSRFKIMDQLLNVIGNGITSSADLALELTYTPFDEEYAKRWITNKSAAYGYDEVDQYGWGVPPCKVAVIEDEKYKYPDIKFWVTYTPGVGRIPYQNFRIGQSTVYTTDFCKYGEAWINAAIWYYRKCKDFFEDHRWIGYKGSYPCESPQQSEKLLCQYAIALQAYSSWKEISDACGVQYLGDNQRFAQDVWNRELARIQGFIATTLENLLEAKKTIAPAETLCLVDSPLVEGGAPASVASAPEQAETTQTTQTQHNMSTKNIALQTIRDIVANGKKLTNVAFAHAAGLSDYAIRQILAGERELTRNEIKTLAGAFGVCQRWLTTGYAFGLPNTPTGEEFTYQVWRDYNAGLEDAMDEGTPRSVQKSAALEKLAWVPPIGAKVIEAMTEGVIRGATEFHLNELVKSANFIFRDLPQSKVSAVHAPMPVKTTMRITTEVFKKKLLNSKKAKADKRPVICTTLP